MNLHFVCTGNVFRSRLAQSYAKYLLKDRTDITITSSGVNASHAKDGPISWYTLKIIEDNDLIPYMSQTWIQTTAEILTKQDLIIFIQPWHLEQCQQRFGYTGTNHQVWDIPDVTPDMSDDQIISFSQKQFELIKLKVSDLVRQLVS